MPKTLNLKNNVKNNKKPVQSFPKKNIKKSLGLKNKNLDEKSFLNLIKNAKFNQILEVVFNNQVKNEPSKVSELTKNLGVEYHTLRYSLNSLKDLNIIEYVMDKDKTYSTSFKLRKKFFDILNKNQKLVFTTTFKDVILTKNVLDVLSEQRDVKKEKIVPVRQHIDVGNINSDVPPLSLEKVDNNLSVTPDNVGVVTGNLNVTCNKINVDLNNKNDVNNNIVLDNNVDTNNQNDLCNQLKNIVSQCNNKTVDHFSKLNTETYVKFVRLLDNKFFTNDILDLVNKYR